MRMQVTGWNSEAEREVISWKVTVSSEHFGLGDSQPCGLLFLVTTHRCVSSQPESCQQESRLSLGFPRDAAACGATSGRGTAPSHPIGTEGPLAILNSCRPQRLTFPLLQAGTTNGVLTLGLLMPISPHLRKHPEARHQNKQPRLCAGPALWGSMMLICPGLCLQ